MGWPPGPTVGAPPQPHPASQRRGGRLQPLGVGCADLRGEPADGACNGERAADAVAVAVPVLGCEDELLGALAVAGPVSRFTPEVRTSHAERLRAAAATLRRRMGLGRRPDGRAGRPTHGGSE